MNIIFYILSSISVLVLLIGLIISFVQYVETKNMYFLYDLIKNAFLIVSMWLMIDYITSSRFYVYQSKIDYKKTEIIILENQKLKEEIKTREYTIGVLTKKLAEKKH